MQTTSVALSWCLLMLATHPVMSPVVVTCSGSYLVVVTCMHADDVGGSVVVPADTGHASRHFACCCYLLLLPVVVVTLLLLPVCMQTTSVALSWCLLMLATHPSVQLAARRELQSVVGDSQPLTYDVLDQLHYCTAVVKETLRCRQLWLAIITHSHSHTHAHARTHTNNS